LKEGWNKGRKEGRKEGREGMKGGRNVLEQRVRPQILLLCNCRPHLPTRASGLQKKTPFKDGRKEGRKEDEGRKDDEGRKMKERKKEDEGRKMKEGK
jgi:hypothetical protein